MEPFLVSCAWGAQAWKRYRSISFEEKAEYQPLFMEKQNSFHLDKCKAHKPEKSYSRIIMSCWFLSFDICHIPPWINTYMHVYTCVCLPVCPSIYFSVCLLSVYVCLCVVYVSEFLCVCVCVSVGIQVLVLEIQYINLVIYVLQSLMQFKKNTKFVLWQAHTNI